MRPLSWKSILNSLVSGRHLSADETEWYMNDLMDGNADPVQVGAVLSMQSALGLTSQEVEGAARAMVGHAVPLKVSGDVTDIVGTGGDGAASSPPRQGSGSSSTGTEPLPARVVQPTAWSSLVSRWT